MTFAFLQIVRQIAITLLRFFTHMSHHFNEFLWFEALNSVLAGRIVSACEAAAVVVAG